jgi:hypothetical protein
VKAFMITILISCFSVNCIFASDFIDTYAGRKKFWKRKITENKNAWRKFDQFKEELKKGIHKRTAVLKEKYEHDIQHNKKKNKIRSKELVKNIFQIKHQEFIPKNSLGGAVKVMANDDVAYYFRSDFDALVVALQNHFNYIAESDNKFQDLQNKFANDALDLNKEKLERLLKYVKANGIWEFPFPPFKADGNKDIGEVERITYLAQYRREHMGMRGWFIKAAFSNAEREAGINFEKDLDREHYKQRVINHNDFIKKNQAKANEFFKGKEKVRWSRNYAIRHKEFLGFANYSGAHLGIITDKQKKTIYKKYDKQRESSIKLLKKESALKIKTEQEFVMKKLAPFSKK